MGKEDIMIKVGFIGAVSKEWMGGLNYFNNLLYAISVLEDKKIEAVIFVGKKTDDEIKNTFKKYAKVVEHPMFDRKSLHWFVWKVLYEIFGSRYFLDILLKKHNIQVLSHTNLYGLKSCKTVNWIPDFQHLHLPGMFSKKEIKSRNESYLELIKKSDKIVLSSYDALKDFNVFTPEYTQKVDVLQFVSQPDNRYFQLNEDDKRVLLEKYNLEKEFFYIPNQFWKHKNHRLVFEAIKNLKDKQQEANVVCTGYMNDYRNKEYINEIKDFIVKNNLEKNIKLLGFIDYQDVFSLIKFSKAVINPSLFEGWSSTVEECKSLGKNMILSDLDVHKEQSPSSVFFNRNNVKSLADVLANYDNIELNNQDISSLRLRTLKFGEKFQTTILDVIDA